MENKRKNLELNNESQNIICGLLDKFEEMSPRIKSIISMRKFIYALIPIGIVYFVTIDFLQKRTAFVELFILLMITLIIIEIFRFSGNNSYEIAKDFGGIQPKMFSKEPNKNTLKALTFNLKLMRRQELKLLKNILKANNLYTIESMKEIREYIQKKKRKPKEIGEFAKNIIVSFFIPITFGVITTYLAIYNTEEANKLMINTAYIIMFSVILMTIAIIVFIISQVKNFSIRDYYTYQCIDELLTELILEKNIKRTNKKKNNIRVGDTYSKNRKRKVREETNKNVEINENKI